VGWWALLCYTSIFLASGWADATGVRITPLSFFGLVLAAELELEIANTIPKGTAKSQCCGLKWARVKNAHEVKRKGKVWGKRTRSRRLNKKALLCCEA